MKRLTGGIAVFAILAAVIAFGQGNGTAVLNAFTKTVNEAKSLDAVYTAQMVGADSIEYKLSLAKPNMARIENDKTIIVADGKTILTYDKKAKTYFKQPQTDKDLMELFEDEDLIVWKTFYNAKAFEKAKAVAKPDRTIAGVKYRVIDLQRDPQNRITTTLFIDSANLARRAQTAIVDGDINENLLLISSKLSVSNEAQPSETYAFNAPDGSREVTMEEMTAATWYTDLEEAKAMAKKTKRKIFVDFYADW